MNKINQSLQALIYLVLFGATSRNRTGDLLITNQLLYRLSHSSKPVSSIPIYLKGFRKILQWSEEKSMLQTRDSDHSMLFF